MEWLRSIGAAWTENMLTDALSDVSLQSETDFIEWLHEQGVPWKPLAELIDLHMLAFGCSDVEVETLLQLVRQGCPWGEWTQRLCECAAKSRHSLQRVFHELGAPCTCERD
jgi:hypothetical protein